MLKCQIWICLSWDPANTLDNNFISASDYILYYCRSRAGVQPPVWIRCPGRRGHGRPRQGVENRPRQVSVYFLCPVVQRSLCTFTLKYSYIAWIRCPVHLRAMVANAKELKPVLGYCVPCIIPCPVYNVHCTYYIYVQLYVQKHFTNYCVLFIKWKIDPSFRRTLFVLCKY